MDNIVTKAGMRMYMLYPLKRAGVVRPVVEYACPVWHTNLPTIIYLSDNIDMIQNIAAKAIFPGMSYVDILKH